MYDKEIEICLLKYMWLHNNIQHFIFRLVQIPPVNSNKQQILDGSVCAPYAAHVGAVYTSL